MSVVGELDFTFSRIQKAIYRVVGVLHKILKTAVKRRVQHTKKLAKLALHR